MEFAGAGTLSCSVKASSACNGIGETVIYRMSGYTDAHAELPNRATTVYNGNVVCCTLGVVGLSNSCLAPYDEVLKLQSLGNSHAQQIGQIGYANNVCISVPDAGMVYVDYQEGGCSTPISYDTTLGSISGTTNAHVGDPSAYPTKICGTATSKAVVGSLSMAVTSVLTSSIFDTELGSGAAYNSIMWKGTLGAENVGKVRFQLAASNSSTPTSWDYYGGSSCGAQDWFDATTPDVAVELKCPTLFNNMRYYRYKVQLCSGDCTTAGELTPTVTDIIVNWTP